VLQCILNSAQVLIF